MTTSEPRDLALQTLYQYEQTGELASLDLLPAKARRLVEGVMDQSGVLDSEIGSASEHWSVERMPVIDRVILRLGLYELRHQTETPVPVVLDEAVRLAKTYSTQRSSSFVNGVLAALAKR